MPTINDATVVASAYDTSGNGGRKLVRLKSGNQYAVAKTASGYFVCKSTNNWATNGAIFKGYSGTTLQDVCLSTDGVYIYILSSINNNTVIFRACNENGDDIGTIINVDTSQTALGNVSLAINEAGTELHATWASKNATYPNSFNIRYAKGTINADGSVTWGAVEQITTVNTSGIDRKNPSVVLNSNGKPIIVHEYYATGGGIYAHRYDGSAWQTSWVHNHTGTYYQSSPSAIFVPQSINGLANGRIWVAWHGSDSSESAFNIRMSYSDDGGLTWSAMQKLTTGNYTSNMATITVNKNGKVFVLFSGTSVDSPSIQQIRKITHNGSSWGSAITVTNNTVNILGYPSSLYESSFNFEEPLFIYMGNKGTQRIGFYGTWTVTTISVTQGSIGTKSDKSNLLTYAITTDGAMSTITEKVNGVAVGTRSLTSGQSQVIGLSQAQWDAVAFGNYAYRNLAPLFSDSRWIKHTNATVSTDRRLTLNATANTQVSYVTIPVKPNSTYTITLTHNGKVDIDSVDISNITTQIVNGAVTGLATVFTTLANSVSIRLYLHNNTVTTGMFTFEDIMLNEGNVSKPNIPFGAPNTLTVEMGSEKWTYTFDKRLASDSDILSAVKATQDAQTTYLPAVKSKLASAVRGKGGTVNDGDSWDTMKTAIDNMPVKRFATGTITSAASSGLVPNQVGTNVSVPYVAFNMANLPFVPSIIEFRFTDKSTLTNSGGTWRKNNFYVSGSNYANSETSANGGFRVPYIYGVVNIPVYLAGVSYDWTAYAE